MRPTQWLALPAACLIGLLIAGTGRAQFPDGHQRAGFPQEVAPWAKPTENPRYVGYTVGGGSGNYRKGEPPLPDEGTWGWDFRGGLIQRSVILNWWHGRRYQGGVGTYETDRSKVLPRE